MVGRVLLCVLVVLNGFRMLLCSNAVCLGFGGGCQVIVMFAKVL